MTREFNTVLTEANLSRIKTHLDSDRPIGILTTYRDGKTLAQNKKSNKELESLIQKAGLGYLKMTGRYIENYGGEDPRPIDEDVFFIIGREGDKTELKALVTKWGKKYDQDSVLYKEGGKSPATLVGTNNSDFPGLGKTVTLGKWVPQKTGEFYTKMRNGRTFVFESLAPSSNFGRYALSVSGKEPSDER